MAITKTWLTLFVVVLYSQSSLAVTKAEEDQVLEICNKALKDNRDLLAGLVRLVFHDCVGPHGCNGCIDDSNHGNAGLDRYIDQLESQFTQNEADKIMSRADFWVLCSIAAIKEGLQYTEVAPEKLKYVMQYGREDCVGGPYRESDGDQYPSPHFDLNSTLAYFREEFALTAKETTALLGAHTLGRAHPEASGFKNPWVPGERIFDNAFYKDMFREELNWIQINVASGDNNSSQKLYQWVHGDSKQFLMFTSDITLARDIDVEADGRVLETYNSRSESSAAVYSRAFAEDMSYWVDEFTKAYTRMTEKTAFAVSLEKPKTAASSGLPTQCPYGRCEDRNSATAKCANVSLLLILFYIFMYLEVGAIY